MRWMILLAALLSACNLNSRDSAIYDGATMVWNVPRAFTGSVRALAYFANGSVQGSDIVNVIAG